MVTDRLAMLEEIGSALGCGPGSMRQASYEWLMAPRVVKGVAGA